MRPAALLFPNLKLICHPMQFFMLASTGRFASCSTSRTPTEKKRAALLAHVPPLCLSLSHSRCDNVCSLTVGAAVAGAALMRVVATLALTALLLS